MRITSTIAGLALLSRLVLAQNSAFDPTLVSGFPNHHYDNDPRGIAIQPDGKILVCGSFTTYGGFPAGSIVRIETDGSVDPSFTAVPGAEDGPYPGSVFCMAVQSDGKILIGGLFEQYNGIPRKSIARLMPDGSLDLTFAPPFLANELNPFIKDIKIRPDGKFYISGLFVDLFGSTVDMIALLNPDGTLDTGFSPPQFGFTEAHGVEHIAIQPDGKILYSCPGRVAQTWDPDTYEYLTWQSFGRLMPNGQFDPDFDGLDDADWPITEYQQLVQVKDIEILPDGKILIAAISHNPSGAGFWEEFGNVFRLNPDGTRDALFVPPPLFLRTGGSISLGNIDEILALPDGDFLISGDFNNVSGYTRPGIVKLRANGTVDADFLPGAGFQPQDVFGGPYHMVLQDDGKVLAVGAFESYQGHISRGLVRIGSTSFVRLFLDVTLEGAYQPNFPGLMRSELYPAGILPLEEPYSGMGFSQIGSGGEHISMNTFPQQSNNLPVDWILVELRSAQDPSQIVATRNAILLDNGHVVDTDGISSVAFYGMNPGLYYVAVKHRNHLSAMTAQPIYIDYAGAFLDFSSPNTQLYGQDATRDVGGMRVLYAGDVNHDGTLRYVGEDNDRDPVLLSIGGNIPTSTVTGYKQEDINLDGVVKYVGEGNDRDPILLNIGGNIPTNTRQAQLP